MGNYGQRPNAKQELQAPAGDVRIDVFRIEDPQQPDVLIVAEKIWTFSRYNKNRYYQPSDTGTAGPEYEPTTLNPLERGHRYRVRRGIQNIKKECGATGAAQTSEGSAVLQATAAKFEQPGPWAKVSSLRILDQESAFLLSGLPSFINGDLELRRHSKVVQGLWQIDTVKASSFDFYLTENDLQRFIPCVQKYGGEVLYLTVTPDEVKVLADIVVQALQTIETGYPLLAEAASILTPGHPEEQFMGVLQSLGEYDQVHVNLVQHWQRLRAKVTEAQTLNVNEVQLSAYNALCIGLQNRLTAAAKLTTLSLRTEVKAKLAARHSAVPFDESKRRPLKEELERLRVYPAMARLLAQAKLIEGAKLVFEISGATLTVGADTIALSGPPEAITRLQNSVRSVQSPGDDFWGGT